MFDDTIINNVRYAKLTATDEEVHEACKAACIHEQILTFSDGEYASVSVAAVANSEAGYNTRVGERGVKLSGGELQRVAIARAILKRPSIVLLDEATSAVDTETEQKIQQALRTLCEGRTTFIVACVESLCLVLPGSCRTDEPCRHRLSTIMNADRIVVVAGGEIVEQGSHEDLIRANGKYAELWSKQIFVKPKDKEASDGTKAVKGRKPPDIVNDLTAEATCSELTKVNSTPAADGQAANGSADSTGNTDDKSASSEQRKEVRG